MSDYCSLADVKAELIAKEVVVEDDALMMKGIRQVSRRIDGMFKIQNLFVPVIVNARRVPIYPSQVNSFDGTLSFGVPLLSLTSVGVNNQNLIVGTNVQSYPPDLSPSYTLQLLGDCWNTWYNYFCSTTRGVPFATIGGVWGYNADYANAWLEVTTLSDAITDTDLTFEVEDFDGPNAYGESPSISAGNVIQIDSEWMDVIKALAVTDEMTLITTYTITVRRGVNGSTAASHLIDAPISVYQVDESIRRAVTRQVAFQYARQGAFETRRVSEFTSVDYPADILSEVYGLLKQFANL